MARGWESKAVADQIEEGNAQRPGLVPNPALSDEERLKQERLTSLSLSKSRLLQQLERATNPGYRAALLKGLKAIESEIDQLTNP